MSEVKHLRDVIRGGSTGDLLAQVLDACELQSVELVLQESIG